MKKMVFKMFLIAEGLLALVLLYQLVQDWELLILLALGLLLIKSSSTDSYRRGWKLWLGWFFLLSAVLSTFTIWAMLALFLVFLVLNGRGLLTDLQLDHFFSVPWKRKSFESVQTKKPSPHNGKRSKQPWLGHTTIGKTVYEWDDINLSILVGDTIIDLGNTLLPQKENVVVIRKGIGQTRIIVPVGIAVSLHHSALGGKVTFEDHSYSLVNETIKLYSDHYDETERKVKIITNCLLGDIEVICL